MHTTLKIASALCTAGLFAGCASTGIGDQLQIAPSYKLSHGAETAAGYYALGRHHHAAARHDEAAKAYERAIALDARHVDALNALGTLYAERGRLVTAIAVLREAARLAPGSSLVIGNLGYASYLNGDYEAAVASLQEAARLDPDNLHARNNLASVMDHLRTSERVEAGPAPGVVETGRVTTYRLQDVQLEAGFVREMDAAAASAWQLQPLTKAVQVQQVEDPGNTVRQVAPNLFEIQPFAPVEGSRAALHTGPATPASPPSTQEAYARAVHAPVQLEISNGNGVTGMAKSTGKIIGSDTLRVVRLTNQPQFDVPASRVEYRAGHEAAARALATMLNLPLAAVHPSPEPERTHLRLVLGRDLPSVAALRRNIATALLAYNKGSGGA